MNKPGVTPFILAKVETKMLYKKIISMFWNLGPMIYEAFANLMSSKVAYLYRIIRSQKTLGI